MNSIFEMKSIIRLGGMIIPKKEDENTYLLVNSRTHKIVLNAYGYPVRCHHSLPMLAENLAFSRAAAAMSEIFPGLTFAQYKMLYEEYVNSDDIPA